MDQTSESDEHGLSMEADSVADRCAERDGALTRSAAAAWLRQSYCCQFAERPDLAVLQQLVVASHEHTAA